MLPDGKKVIITVAPTGGFQTKKDNPNIPEQPNEIAEDVHRCYQEGAAIAHIHARDKNGKPTADAAVYEEIADRIRAKCGDIVFNFSTGGAPGLSLEEKTQCLRLRPEIASLNMGTLIRTFGPLAGTPNLYMRESIESIAKRMLELGVKPEMEVYNHAMFSEVENLIKQNLVKAPYLVNIVLGMPYQGAEPGTVKTLLSMVEFVPRGSVVNVCAIGRAQLPLTTISMLLGGMARIGLEDNIYYSRGALAQSNAQLVSRTVRLAKELNLEIASVKETREILGLQ